MTQEFDISALQDASILTLDDMRSSIMISPDYQREGKLWSRTKKQLFIDTLLNKYDVPKFYLHKLTGNYKNAQYDYSVIDGRQRLETIWEFLASEFPLANDFALIDDQAVALGGKYFKEFPSINARLSTRLYGRVLPIMVVTTDDIDYIEDMFTRLNDGVPLNAAEKRNAFGGPLPKITREIAEHIFFKDRVRVSSTRYRHLDIAGKLLWLAYNAITQGKVADTKKATVDTFFHASRDEQPAHFDLARAAVDGALNAMADLFGSKDVLLRSSGVIPVYFFLFLSGFGPEAGVVERGKLQAFEELRAANRELFEAESDEVDFKLIEYDELAQSSNDAASIEARLATLINYLQPK
jgi:hypothetical protein